MTLTKIHKHKNTLIKGIIQFLFIILVAFLVLTARGSPNSTVRQDSGQEGRNKISQASLVMPTPVPRSAEKITIELDEPIEEPSPKKSRTRSTSTSKEKEKHKILEAPQEAEESQPASKKSRVRTSSASKEKKDKWKVEDISQDNEAGDAEKIKRTKSQAEDVFAGSPRTVSVFKESDSWA